jgi:hypothetical protein
MLDYVQQWKWMKTVVPDMPILAIGVRDYPNLTSFKVYTAINGREEGIFETSPFVTVIGDDGKKLTCHLSRFGPVVTASDTDGLTASDTDGLTA